MMNTKEKKVTKRERYAELLALNEVKGNPELVAFIEHEIELLNKKASGEKKPSAVQVANEGIKEVIYNVLAENGKAMTITEIQKSDEELTAMSNQRISALVRQLKEEGRVERFEEKRKAYFKAI